MNTTIITRKISLIIPGETKEERDAKWKYLRDLEWKCFHVANEAMAAYFVDSNIKKLVPGHTYTEMTGKSLQNLAYEVTKNEEYSDVMSEIRVNVSNFVYNRFKNDRKDIFVGNKSLSTFKRGFPIPFNIKNSSTKQLRLRREGENDFLSFPGLDGEFILKYGRDKSGNRVIVDRILNKEYEVTQVASIKYVRGDNEFVLLLTVKIPVEEKELDPAICIGVDVGVSIPAVIATADGEFVKYVGNRNELKDFRIQQERKRQFKSRSAAGARSGHGRTRKLKAADRMGNYEKNFATTYNHKLSKIIIDDAIKARAGVIKMENLSGIMDDKERKKNLVLGRWSYYQLQNFIEIKAKKYGIEIVYINPKYTSQTCSKCGNLEPGQRLNQSEFECKKCGFKKNADVNAAINIAKSTNIANL